MTEKNEALYEIYKNRVVDNRNVSMEFAINHLLSQNKVDRFDLAVGYFYISGLLLIKDTFTEFMEVRDGHMSILMGNETNELTKNTVQAGFYISELNDDELKNDYKNQFQDEIRYLNEEDQLFLMKFIDWLEQKRIEVKVYTGEANYFHAKSYMFYGKENDYSGESLVGSSNFSRNGLQGNTELNVYSADSFNALHEWFKSIWFSDEVDVFSDELIKTIKQVYPDIQQSKRYKSVSETYYDFANMFARPYAQLDDDKIWEALYPHQREGILKIQNKLMQFGTATLADGVGLGKTRTTAGVIRLEKKINPHLKVIIIADKKLHEQWQADLDAVDVDYSNFIFINRETFALMKPAELDLIAATYQMIVIDEGHQGFKNRTTAAYRHAEYVFSHSAHNMKGIMLTATPWNNKREDVINIGSLFLEVDNIPLDRTYRTYFAFGARGKAVKALANDNKAFAEFWEDLFLQRTRKTYGGESVTFAERFFPTIEVPFEPVKEQIFSNNFERIDNLHFPYMDTLRFFVQDSNNELTPGRLKLMLLKRADSSWLSFVNSLKAIQTKTQQFVKDFDAIETSGKYLDRLKNYLSHAYKVDEYFSNNLGLLLNIKNEEDEDQLPNQFREFQEKSNRNRRKYIERITGQIESLTVKSSKRVFNTLKAYAVKDLAVLQSMIDEVEKNFLRKDEKFETVLQSLIIEREKGHKVILVSQFRDTILYYADKIKESKKFDPENIGVVTGNPDDNKIGMDHYSKNAILNRFSPKSKLQTELFNSENEINILLGTDTISTGQNLQDATVLMNLDVPYNPMQLEQRIGRIDRPREYGQVEQIDIYTFPTYSAIESILKMTQRLGEKMKGIYSDTEFDDFVLPEYREYAEALLKEKNATKASKATEKMVLDNESKQIMNVGVSADSHSADYDMANKRMYDTVQQGVHRVLDPIYDDISFSKNIGNAIVVLKMIYRDVNGEDISNETIIIDMDEIKECTISDAERRLNESKVASVYSTQEYSEAKAEVKIRDYRQKFQQVLERHIEKINDDNQKTRDNFDGIADKTSKKAASNIIDSIKNPKLRGTIKSKIEAFGLSGKEVQELAKRIEFIDSDSDLYDYVQNIANDVQEFWMNFEEYVDAFDLQNIELNSGRINKNEPTKRIATVENSEVILVMANYSIGNESL